MAEGQAKWKGTGTKENPSDTIPKQGVKDQAFSSQEAFTALCAASPATPGTPTPSRELQLYRTRRPELGWGGLGFLLSFCRDF